MLVIEGPEASATQAVLCVMLVISGARDQLDRRNGCSAFCVSVKECPEAGVPLFLGC